MRNKLFFVALGLLALGITFYIVDLAVFIPRISAFQHASLDWAHNHTSTQPPNPADFGVGTNTFIISTLLAYASGASLLLGAAYLVILLIAKIIRQLGYMGGNRA